MNKFDPDSVPYILAMDAAESRHPKPSELPSRRFPAWNCPAVMVGQMRGTAIAWTVNYGLVQFTDVSGESRMEWFEALLIKRVEK